MDRIVDEDGYIRPDASLELKNIKADITKLKNKSDQVLKYKKVLFLIVHYLSLPFLHSYYNHKFSI